MSTEFPTSLIGVACLVWWQGRLVLEVQKPHKWHSDALQEVHISLGCIGGRVNEGEGAIEALEREALEEIGCRIELQDAPVTYMVTPDCQVHPGIWQDPGIRQVLVWEACLPGLIPGRSVAVFRGRSAAEPMPGDLPALLSMPPELLFRIDGAGLRLDEARMLGAVLCAQTSVPDKAWLDLVGTPAVLTLLYPQWENLVKELLKPVL